MHADVIAEGPNVVAVAVGDGQNTHGARQLVRRSYPKIPIFVIREAGASVYSASQVAEDELPEIPVQHRGAVSIARRLLDPMSEYVKVEPSSLGIGLFQKDVTLGVLTEILDHAVEDTVSAVGVDLNTASVSLLSKVGGLSPKLAAKIRSHAPFRRRTDLLQVPGVGPKTFENIAGFLRITNGPDLLDATRVHPESYVAARQELRRAKVTDDDLRALILRGGGFDDEIKSKFDLDILKDPYLAGDPRSHMRPAAPAIDDSGPSSLDAVQVGDVFKNAVVTNVVAFGAFIDVGLEESGLLHVSRYGSLSPVVGQTLAVVVDTVDLDRRRLGLAPFLKNKRSRTEDPSSSDHDPKPTKTKKSKR